MVQSERDKAARKRVQTFYIKASKVKIVLASEKPSRMPTPFRPRLPTAGPPSTRAAAWSGHY